MREHENEAKNRNNERSDSFFDWFGWNRIPDSDQSGQHSTVARLHNVSRPERYSWVDFDSTWYSYRLAVTIVYCGFFGLGIGQCLKQLMGAG